MFAKKKKTYKNKNNVIKDERCNHTKIKWYLTRMWMSVIVDSFLIDIKN